MHQSCLFILTIMLLASTSCATRERCMRRFPEISREARLSRIDREIRIEQLPPASVQHTFSVPLWMQAPADTIWLGREVIKYDSSNSVRMQLQYDSLHRRLRAECHSLPREVINIRERESYRKAPVALADISIWGQIQRGLLLAGAAAAGFAIGRWFR